MTNKFFLVLLLIFITKEGYGDDNCIDYNIKVETRADSVFVNFVESLSRYKSLYSYRQRALTFVLDINKDRLEVIVVTGGIYEDYDIEWYNFWYGKLLRVTPYKSESSDRELTTIFDEVDKLVKNRTSIDCDSCSSPQSDAWIKSNVQVYYAEKGKILFSQCCKLSCKNEVINAVRNASKRINKVRYDSSVRAIRTRKKLERKDK